MELATEIHKFIENPFPLWETTLTRQLIQQHWIELKSKGFQSFSDYSTAGFWLGDSTLEIVQKKEIAESTLCVEMPSFQLQSFYEEHGLDLLTENEIEGDAALLKLKKAISILRLIEPVYDCITNLVRSIHILRQPDEEIDVSYSHPQIPFSIFLSVCEDDSIVSNLRVAESILHETMHLKLTLIEKIVLLVKPNTRCLYYSPWRDKVRPVRGVLHGLFVFRSIGEFYKELYKMNKLLEAEDYLGTRISQIKNEIELLKDFPASLGLTEAGANLVTSLWPWN